MERIKKRTEQQIIEDLARSASVVKLVCGVANNATWLVMMDAHDSIKKHPNYRGRVKYLYKQAFKEFKNNERQLLYANENRMFHLADMTPETRKIYGNITDAQYFEYWRGLGAKAYTEGHQWVSSLDNKYRLSLLKHQTSNAEILAKVMTAQACLELASHMYESALNACVKDFELPMSIMRDIFKYFSLRKVADIWKNALTMTAPDTQNYELDEVEDKNIAQGIMQLEMEWSDPKMIYGSAFTATEDFEEIFRTKGEWKKAMMEIGEVKNSI
jgi:hypothetical protein